METENRLQVGVDVGMNQVHLALLAPDGKILLKHRSFTNSVVGYGQVRELLLEVMRAHAMEGVDLAAEATSYYWLPFFCQLAQDPLLAAFQPRELLLNATWVKWYRKSLSPDHKSDRSDPFYIGDHLRSLADKHWWQLDEHWLSLRFRTRLHAHLAKSLAREKSYYQLILFLNYSAYAQAEPFSDTFGVLSQTLLNDPQRLEKLCQLPDLELCARLDRLSGHRLPNPLHTALRLKQALQDSFPVPAGLRTPLQDTLQRLARLIQTLQEQIHTLDAEILALVQEGYPEVAHLRSVPGVGPVTACGVAAEIADLHHFETPLKWNPHHNAYGPRTLQDVEDAVAKFAGLWWPQNASGNFDAEDRPLSRRGNAYLRYYLTQAADHMRRVIPSYASYYHRKFAEATKHRHKRALVLTARKAVALFVGLLHHQEDYRPQEGLLKSS